MTRRIFCYVCNGELTSTDADAKFCTQCKTPLRLTIPDWEELKRYEQN